MLEVSNFRQCFYITVTLYKLAILSLHLLCICSMEFKFDTSPKCTRAALQHYFHVDMDNGIIGI